MITNNEMPRLSFVFILKRVNFGLEEASRSDCHSDKSNLRPINLRREVFHGFQDATTFVGKQRLLKLLFSIYDINEFLTIEKCDEKTQFSSIKMSQLSVIIDKPNDRPDFG